MSLTFIMKAQYLLTVLILIMQYSLIAKDYTTYRDDKARLVIDGELSRADWYSETDWNLDSIAQYHPDAARCLEIKNICGKDSVEFIIIAGSWCGDTKSELPKLMKVFDVCKLEPDDYILVGVGKDKVINTNISKSINVDRVPTLIILKNGLELGRIIEYPELSWEHDIAIVLGE